MKKVGSQKSGENPLFVPERPHDPIEGVGIRIHLEKNRGEKKAPCKGM